MSTVRSWTSGGSWGACISGISSVAPAFFGVAKIHLPCKVGSISQDCDLIYLPNRAIVVAW
jgi:hypothetical protein